MNKMNEERIKIEAIDGYLRALEHAWSAYFFFFQCISNRDIRSTVSNVRFERNSQVESMIIELGWSFFCNMEASLEVLIHKLGYKNVQDLLEKESLESKFNDNEREGLRLYREIRNTLHHGAGDPRLLKRKPKHLKVEERKELQLGYEHMCNFCKLFKKIGLELKKCYED